MKYTDVEYAKSRVLNTFIRHNGKLWYVDHITDGGEFRLYNNGGELLKDRINNIDLSPPELGYFNTDLYCHYCFRIPKRRDWKQGIRRSNIDFTQNYETVPYFNTNGYNDLYRLDQCVGKAYPTLTSCIDFIQDYKVSIAFSNNFALDERGSIIYKGLYPVGIINKQTNQPELYNKFKYLQESLEGCVNV